MNPEPPSESTLRFWRRTFWVSIAMMVIPPLVGAAGTVFGMFQAFETMGVSGASDPKALAESISISLWTTVAGLVVAIAGLILFIICLIRYFTLRKYRKQIA